MNVFELFATLSLDTSNYDDALDQSEQKGSSFASKLGSGLATTGKMAAGAMALTAGATIAVGKSFVDGVSDVASYGDSVDKMSQRLGISAEKFQTFDYVLNLAGTSMNDMQVGMKTLTNKLDDAKNGSEEAQAMFAQLGISLEDLNTMSREDLFEQTIYGFQDMADSTERAALANDLFGKSGQTLTPLFNQTKEQTQEQIAMAKEYGMVMSDEAVSASADFVDSLTTLQGTLTGLKNGMLSEFLPAFSTTMDGLAAVFAGDSEGGLAKIEEGVNSIADTMTAQLPTFIQIGGSILSALVTSLTKNLPTLVSTGLSVVRQLASAIVSNLPALASAAVQIITELASFLADPSAVNTLIDTALVVIQVLAEGLNEALPVLIPAVVNIILAIIDKLTQPETMMMLTDATFTLFGGLIEGIIKAIPSIVATIPRLVAQIIVTITQSFPVIIANVLSLITDLGVSIGEQLGINLSDNWNTISNGLTDIKNKLKEGLDEAVKVVDGILDSISEKFTSIFDTIKDTVKNAIDTILDLFDFDWSLPDIKLPHFKIDGGEAPYGLGGKGTFPSVSVEWYAKAYDSAYMLSDATIFGSMSGNLIGGGENGNEMIVGEEYFRNTMLEAASRIQIQPVVSVYIAGEEIDSYTVSADQRIALVGGGRG